MLALQTHALVTRRQINLLT